MNMSKILKMAVYILTLLFFVVNLSFSFVYDYAVNGDCVTMLSAFWSVLATVALGGIALWQNSRYKKLADEANDIMLMPEIYMPVSPSERISSASNSLSLFNQIVVKLKDVTDTQTVRFHNFHFLKTPILNIQFDSLYCDGKVYLCVQQDKFSAYNDSEIFQLRLSIPKECLRRKNDYSLKCTYENIYGTRYEKNINFILDKSKAYVDQCFCEKGRRI